MTEAQRENREALVSYFEAGCKTSRTLGFELEHILLHASDDSPVSYDEDGGVRSILEALASRYRETHCENGRPIGLSRCRETISIEPAGQLEISAGPCSRVREVDAAYRSFRSLLDPIMDKLGVYTPLLGYHPSACARDLQLVPKRRYECMTDFLGAQSYSALCMMRGTASLQISVDYESEEDACRKLRVAEKLSPVLALICDNSPVFEAAPTQGHMARTGVWLGMWQDRVGTIPGSLDPGFGFADYADYILTRQAVLVPDGTADGGFRYVGSATFDEIYAQRTMSTPELEHALSMVWPDARLKNFVEIRPADALPAEHAFSYTALVNSVFYHAPTLTRLDDELADVGEAEVLEAKRALMEDGYEAQAYGKTAAWWADLVFELAYEAASSEDACYLKPLADLVSERRTLADMAR